MDIARRAFLHGHRSLQTAAPRRPPWAVDEALFQHICFRCGACVTNCPTGLLVQGAGGFPEADFHRGHCTFCADCAHACAAAVRKNGFRHDPALAFSPEHPPWTLRAGIGADCLPGKGVLCRSCEDHCEAGIIRFVPRIGAPAQPDIETSVCTGCGECVAACPAGAISMRSGVSPPSSTSKGLCS
ncbi:MAG: ferredoxin-type protein NapF [Azoarcus sp.]|nr:ferredoxin-type protein NapF [Azoarcus sp.]